MKFRSLVYLALAAAAHTAPGNAQTSTNIRPCSAGIEGNGFLDWTKLPTTPNGKALNASIPVTGIPGLTATVQIPANGNFDYLNGATFSVNSPISLGVPTNSVVTVVFSHPVKGVSASVANGGRNTRTATMSAYNSGTTSGGAPIPAGAVASANAFDEQSPGDVATTPLQIRSESENIDEIVIQFSDGNDDEHFYYNVINLRVESGSGPDPSLQVPRIGLKQWLRADTVYEPYAAFIPLTSWPDQSGNHANAAGTFLPALPDGLNCSPAVSNFGNGLSANLPIDGWTGMTVFMVSSSAADVGGWWENQPLFWNETAYWGSTFFTPSQSNVFFRFGTTQTNNEPIYARPVNVGGDYTLTTAIHNGATDSLYLNGVLAFQQGGKLAAISGVGSTESIGAGLANTYFTGSIGEILIYDRALTDTERDTVEHYLMKKFGLY